VNNNRTKKEYQVKIFYVLDLVWNLAQAKAGLSLEGNRMRCNFILSAMFSIGIIAGAASASAGEASVLDVTVSSNADGTYAFNVTVAHQDEGWTHYANNWDVLSPDGSFLGTRTLFHPHVNEQPFTRSLSQVKVPIGVSEVIVSASDSKHGDGTRTFKVKLPPRK